MQSGHRVNVPENSRLKRKQAHAYRENDPAYPSACQHLFGGLIATFSICETRLELPQHASRFNCQVLAIDMSIFAVKVGTKFFFLFVLYTFERFNRENSEARCVTRGERKSRESAIKFYSVRKLRMYVLSLTTNVF